MGCFRLDHKLIISHLIFIIIISLEKSRQSRQCSFRSGIVKMNEKHERTQIVEEGVHIPLRLLGLYRIGDPVRLQHQTEVQ